MTGTELVHKMFVLHGGQGTPAGPLSTPWIGTGKYRHLTFVVSVKNATTVTASTITLSQAKTVTGTDAKSLPFAKAFRVDTWATPANAKYQEFAVTNDAFDTVTTNNVSQTYIIEVEDEMLDRDNDYTYVRLNMANGVNCVANIEVVCSIARDAGHARVLTSPVV